MFPRVARFTAGEGRVVSWSSWWMVGSSCVMIVQVRLSIDGLVSVSEIKSGRWCLDHKGKIEGKGEGREGLN